MQQKWGTGASAPFPQIIPSDSILGQPVERTTPNYISLDFTELVRSLQRTEVYQDCFRWGQEDSGELDCAWRAPWKA